VINEQQQQQNDGIGKEHQQDMIMSSIECQCDLTDEQLQSQSVCDLSTVDYGTLL
jgi:hypothetical protein